MRYFLILAMFFALAQARVDVSISTPNVFIDISKVINKKTKILHLYKSAHIVFQYADITKGLNRYRGTQANLPLGFAEAFYIDSVYNYMKKNYRIKLDGK